MITLQNALAHPLTLSDGNLLFNVPPGGKITLTSTNAWTMTSSNAPEATLPASDSSYSATIAFAPGSGTLELAQVETLDLAGMTMTGMVLVLGVGLPIVALRWFQRLTSVRLED